VLFQFHFGSIGSLFLIYQNKGPWLVSIPLWFDWKLLHIFLAVFQKGFNSTLVRLEVKTHRIIYLSTLVSIPLWFDWKKNTYSLTEAEICFNSTLVRLEVSPDYSKGFAN